MIPEGFLPVPDVEVWQDGQRYTEVWTDGIGVVVVAGEDALPEAHDCGANGCGQGRHVLLRMIDTRDQRGKKRLGRRRPASLESGP